MSGPAADIRVLDFSSGAAGSLAAMVLADFGAEVIRVEPEAATIDEHDPAYLLFHRGKKSIVVNLHQPEGVASVHRLLPGIDVVVTDAGWHADARGIDYATLSGHNQALVYCSITAFGTAGPFRDVPADDALVMAKSGLLRDQPGWEQDGMRPIFRTCPDPSYFAAMLSVQGILAALRARDLTGRGQRVDTSLLQALACRQNPQIRWLLRDGEDLPPDRAGGSTSVPDSVNPLAHHRDPREVSVIGMLTECADGTWIIHALTEPHFFPAWIEAIGFEWIWDDERFKGAPHKFASPDLRLELVQLLKDRIKEKSSAEWMERYLANGNVCADVIQTTREALHHPQVVGTGGLVEFDDPRVGSMVQIGPLAHLPAAPGNVRGPAPVRGEHTDEVLGAAVNPIRLPAPSRDQLAGPLEGITIVEAAYYYATPFGTAILADLGARVIKVEPINGDPYRRLGRGTGDPVLALGHNNMVRAMQGKESIALDLKSARGREVLHQLVDRSDVFVHNFRKGVPETLGIDEATLRAINPALVYQYGAAYGSSGPYAGQPAIDPVIAAFAGTTAYQAGEGRPPLRESGADPAAAAGHATALMLALFARHRSGAGQYVESAMIISNIYLNYTDALDYADKPSRPAFDHEQRGTSATRRLYETATADAVDATSPHGNPNPHWVMLSASADTAFGRFCEVAGRPDIIDDPRFATSDGRDRHRADLEPLLESVFLTRSAIDWETNLLAVGVGCVRADANSAFDFLYEDTQALAIGLMTEVHHPSFGTYWRHAPMLELSDTHGIAGTFCELGEHTEALLCELGYSVDHIETLIAEQVVAAHRPALVSEQPA